MKESMKDRKRERKRERQTKTAKFDRERRDKI